MSDTDLAQKIKNRMGQMESDRSAWATHCQEIVQYMMPFRTDVMIPEAANKGIKKMQYIYDSTATHALAALCGRHGLPDG